MSLISIMVLLTIMSLVSMITWLTQMSVMFLMQTPIACKYTIHIYTWLTHISRLNRDLLYMVPPGSMQLLLTLSITTFFMSLISLPYVI
jgi:hypothetical protein